MFQGTALVKRGPLYQICLAREEEAKKQEFNDRIRDLREQARLEREKEEREAYAKKKAELRAIERVRQRKTISEKQALLPRSQTPNIRFIRDVVIAYFDIPLEEIIGRNRSKQFNMPRHIAFWLTYKFSIRSTPEIGRLYGGRDHTTILSSIKQVDKKLAAGDQEYINCIRELRLALSESGLQDQMYWGS
jgi:hypothetical protein